MDPRHIDVPRLSQEDWRGKLRPVYQDADQWYRQQLIRLGLLRPDPLPARQSVMAFDNLWADRP